MSSTDLEQRSTFAGFARDRGRPGIRNRVLVIPSVICSHFVADTIAESVPRAVAASHDHGCAQIGIDKETTRRTMINVGLNPNISGVVVVGLGCEGVQSSVVVEGVEEAGVPVESVVIQELGGTDPCIDAGRDIASKFATSAERAPIDMSSLTVGIVSSDLEETTLDIAEPKVTRLIEKLTDAGARTVVAGTERFVAAADALDSRLDTSKAREGYEEMVDRHLDTVPRLTRTQQRVEELPSSSLTGILGSSHVRDVLGYGERATHQEGVAIVDAPLRFEEAATALAAAGAQVIVHVTGEGVPTGHPIAPVIKLTGDDATAAALAADIDRDARETNVDDLFDLVRSVAEGAETRAETHGVADFAISRFGPSM